MTKPLPTLADRSAEYILKNGLLSTGDHVLAAVSGGPDSVALLDILSWLKDKFRLKQIAVAHFDHRLRGEESDADSEFVRKLAADYRMDFHAGSAEVRDYAVAKGLSIEMAARARRHSFLKEIAAAMGASAIALGHTADDQAEEVLLRLLRGSGPAGLKAMLPRTRKGIIRPLLFASREEVLDYLDSRRLSYRMDSSNLEPFCQRNALRLRVFPLLREIFHPEAARTISRYAELARDEESWWSEQVERAWQGCGELSETGASLNLEVLRGMHPAMVRRMLRYAIERVKGSLSAIQAVHLEPLYSMVLKDMPGRSVRLPGDMEAVQRGGRLVIRIRGPETWLPAATGELEILGPGIYEFGAFRFEIELVDAAEDSPSPDSFDYNLERISCGAGFPACHRRSEVLMDADAIRWPLNVRLWKPGDRFFPLGMKGSKKIQDFFMDLKIPREERHTIPIVCDTEKICWISGFRMDERVKAGSDTGRLVRIRMVTTKSR